jgi:hypothetical protein
MGRTRYACALVLLWAACGGDEGPRFQDTDGGPLIDSPPRIDGPPGDDGGVVLPDGSVDNAGPVITLIRPDPGALIRGTFVLEVEVVDVGLDDVTATIGASSITMTRVGATSRFLGTVNTAPLAGLVAPTIIVRASDIGGLTSELGFVIVLDNQGPISSLDPPNVRTTSFIAGIQVCSVDLDPVGNDAPNDGETVPQLFELRARAIDVGNTGTVNSTVFIPNAGIRSVEVYVFDNTTKPLIVDTDGDGVCDDINPEITPTTVPVFANEAAVVGLQGIEPKGGGFFTNDTFGGTNATACATGDAVEAPPPLCFGESATVAIKTLAGDPQIFGMPPVDDFNCMGFAFDALAANISDGFACVAVLTVDNLGNRSVSEPLRVCIDSNVNGDNGCGAMGSIAAAGARPNCTGTFAGGVTNNTACTPRRFFSGVANEFELVTE